MSKLIIFGAILFSGLLGAPTTELENNCSEAENIKGVFCGMTALDFYEKAKTLDVKSKEGFRELRKPCSELKNCISTIAHCSVFQEKKVKEQLSIISKLCREIEFATGVFADCDQKLDDNESICYKDWDIFKIDEGLNDEDKREEVCKNIFGREQCLKEEVTETCGVENWEKLRDHVLSMNQNSKECDLDAIF